MSNLLPFRRRDSGDGEQDNNLPAVVQDAEVVPAEPDEAELVPVDQGGILPGESEVPPGRMRPPFDLKPVRIHRGEVVDRPVLAPWIRDRHERRQAAKWAAHYTGHTTAYHAARLPLYSIKLAAYSPRGTLRAIGAVARWVGDVEGKPLRQTAVVKGDVSAYMALSRQRNERVRLRMAIVGGSAALLLAAAGVSSLYVDHVLPAVLVLIVLVTGRLGAPADRPMVSRAVVVSEAPRLTSDIVTQALGSLGIAGINQALGKGGSGIAFPAPITRDGPGWRADIDLPLGVTFADIMGKRRELASGLRRQLGAVWPEGDPKIHEGRLVLWVGDQDMAQVKPKPWPLAKTGTADFFAPIPFGKDTRGRGVQVTLFENNILIGSLPGGGKTATVRVLALGAALDVTCELWVYELKGSGDLESLEKVAHRYASGPDDDTIEQVLFMFRDLKKEVLRRAAALKAVPRDMRPDSKITRELATKKTLGLHPLVVIVDECQNVFGHDRFGKEAGELAIECIKLGRALGVTLVLATQRPDKDSLPTGVTANVSVRFCLRMMGQTENDMVLGTSSYRNGVRATTLRPSDKGIGWLVGAYDDPKVIRTDYIKMDVAEAISLRARKLREAAGTLSGCALGEAPQTAPAYDVLTDVQGVFRAGEDALWSEAALPRLTELRPEIYADWDVKTFGAAMKSAGCPTEQIGRRIDGKPVTRWGVTLEQLQAAIRQRGAR